MREVSEINHEWLLEIAPHFYVDKRKINLELKHKHETQKQLNSSSKLSKLSGQQTSNENSISSVLLKKENKLKRMRNTFQQFSTRKTTAPQNESIAGKKNFKRISKSASKNNLISFDEEEDY
jgi:hypothetical protein